MSAKRTFIRALKAERVKQDAIWGGVEHDQTHDLHLWRDILQERLNRLNLLPFSLNHNSIEQARARRLFIETAAIACAAYEASFA